MSTYRPHNWDMPTVGSLYPSGVRARFTSPPPTDLWAPKPESTEGHRWTA